MVPTASNLIETVAAAAARWSDIVGAEHVVTSGDEIALANLATCESAGQVLAIVRPGTRAEVQRCVMVAHELRVPLHPVSRGRNWGYGSRTPPLGRAVLMELKRMDRIVEFSEELAFVRVQPGVTFEQLSDFLEARGSSLQLDATAGPQDGSIVGNGLERGRSHGPGMLPGRPIGDFEVVLADGRVIHTSSRRFPAAAHAATEPFPIGPDIAGLFFESNLGIVTEITLWLNRRPRHVWLLRLGLPDQASLGRIVPTVRDLMLDGVLTAQSVLLVNDHRWRHSARFSPHTVNEYDEEQPLWPDKDLAWLCQATVYGSDALIAQRKLELVKRALEPHAIVSYEMPLTNVGGKPFPEYLRNPLWTKQTPPEPDLDRDRVGYIFVAPVAPAVPEDICHVYEAMRDLLLRDGFEPYINIRFWEARSVVFVGAIVYDRDEPGADERAAACYRRVLEQLGRRGYLPYRMPTFAMQELPHPTDDFGSMWADLKRTLDPHDIISPGRYDFRYCWPE